MSMDDETAAYAREEEGDDEEEVIEGKEYIVFLIDAAASMFDTMIEFSGKMQSTFAVAVQVAMDCMKRKILTSASDEFAVVLYNTAKKAEVKGCEENVYVYVERDIPSVDEIQALANLTDEQFQAEIGTLPGDALASDIENLEKAFTTVTTILQGGRQSIKGKTLMPKPRIFLFTNEEVPKVATDPGYKDKLMVRINTLKVMEATLAVFPLVSVLRPFNFAPFWHEIQEALPDEEGHESVQGLTDVGHVEERMQALFDNLQKRMEKRRTLGSLVLSIPGSSSIGLQLFKLTVALGAPKSVYVHAQTNELVVPKTRHELTTTGTHVAPSLEQQHQRQKEYKKVFRSVDKKNPERAIQAIFSSEEVVRELRGLFGQGIELLGFKPLSKLQDYHNLKTSTFVRPTEQKVRGSIRLFKALLDAMLSQNKMAVCRFTRSPGTQPSMVALLPQASETDPFGYQVSPEGMHLIPLPYADDIRMPEKQAPIVEPSESHIHHASALIDRLPYEFVLGMVPDPALHHHFNVLEAMALNREPPTVEDSRKEDQTIVPNEDIDEQAGQELEEFKENVMGPDYKPFQGKTGAGKGTKRARGDDAGLATTYANLPWADMIRTGEPALMKRTAEDLKVYLAFHRLPVSGVKKDLVARILKHANKE